MAVKVLELHHHGIRVGPSPADVKKAYGFYHDVLGLDADQGRPTIPTIDGFWMDVGGSAQIHLMGVDGASKFAQGPDKDPSRPHVALAVPDIQEAKEELDADGRGLLGDHRRGRPAVAADLHVRPVRQHDRAAPGRDLPLRHRKSQARRGHELALLVHRGPESPPRAGRPAHAGVHRPARGRVRCGGRQPDRFLARARPRGLSGLVHPHRPRGSRPRHADLHRRDPHHRPGLRQHRDDRAHALHGHALHRRARHRGPEAPLLRRGGARRQALRELGQRAGGEPLPHLPDGDGGPPGRRRLRGGRGEALLHDGPRRLALHGLVRARGRHRHEQGPAPGAGARGRPRHRHRRQVEHAGHARDLQPLGHLHRRAGAEGRGARRPGRRAPGGRGGELRAGLRRGVRRASRRARSPSRSTTPRSAS